MITVGRKITVSTTPAEVFRCRANQIQFLNVRAVGALSLVTEGGSVDDGLPLSASEAVGFSKDDFAGLPGTEAFTLWAVAAAPTSIHIYGMLKE